MKKAIAKLIENIDIHVGGLLGTILILVILSSVLKLSEKVEDNIANLITVFGGGVITLTKATSGKEEDKEKEYSSQNPFTSCPNNNDQGGYYIDDEE